LKQEAMLVKKIKTAIESHHKKRSTVSLKEKSINLRNGSFEINKPKEQIILGGLEFG